MSDRASYYIIVCFRDARYPAFRVKRPKNGSIDQALRQNLRLPNWITHDDLHVYSSERYEHGHSRLATLAPGKWNPTSEINAALNAARVSCLFAEQLERESLESLI